MDFGKFLFLGLLWFVFNLLRQGAKKRPAARRPARQPEPKPLPPSGIDPTQREGARLETLLGNLNRSLEEVTRAKAKAAETAQGLESTDPRPERAVVDQDELAEQVVASRIAAAEARSGVLTEADHRAFDERIRQEPRDHTAVRTRTAEQLRDAVVWREILGPPVALRDERPDRTKTKRTASN